MNQQIPIQDIAAQFNLTSRTLRYWEQKGLYKSSRDSQSNWRVYGNEAIERIRLVVLLRELDIPIKNIKKIIETGETCTVANVFEMQLHKLGSESHEIMKKVDLLNKCLNAVNSLDNVSSEHNFIKKLKKHYHFKCHQNKI